MGESCSGNEREILQWIISGEAVRPVNFLHTLDVYPSAHGTLKCKANIRRVSQLSHPASQYCGVFCVLLGSVEVKPGAKVFEA